MKDIQGVFVHCPKVRGLIQMKECQACEWHKGFLMERFFVYLDDDGSMNYEKMPFDKVQLQHKGLPYQAAELPTGVDCRFPRVAAIETVSGYGPIEQPKYVTQLRAELEPMRPAAKELQENIIKQIEERKRKVLENSFVLDRGERIRRPGGES